MFARSQRGSFPEPIHRDESVRRRRLIVAVTLVIGTALLAMTLRVPAGSTDFFVIGFFAASAWILGAVASGPIPIDSIGSSRTKVVFTAIAIGAVAFLCFLVADLVGQHLPLVSPSLHNILIKADAGPTGLVLLVALVNGLGEELFFRGALFSAFGDHGPIAGSTALYVAVTAATGSVALVIAAGAMGTLLAYERRRTAAILAPTVTHLCWSTLMLLALPR